MDMQFAVAIGVWNIVAAPLLIYTIFSSGFLMYPLAVRIGFAISACGQFFQALFNFTNVNQLEGYGLLWFLKDLGLGIVAFAIITDQLTKRHRKHIEKTRKIDVMFTSEIDDDLPESQHREYEIDRRKSKRDEDND